MFASYIRGPRFESRHQPTFISNTNCIEKTKIKKKRPIFQIKKIVTIQFPVPFKVLCDVDDDLECKIIRISLIPIEKRKRKTNTVSRLLFCQSLPLSFTHFLPPAIPFQWKYGPRSMQTCVLMSLPSKHWFVKRNDDDTSGELKKRWYQPTRVHTIRDSITQ